MQDHSDIYKLSSLDECDPEPELFKWPSFQGVCVCSCVVYCTPGLDEAKDRLGEGIHFDWKLD